MPIKKILIIRFSSIGDIVLTTPVIRSLARQFPTSDIHFLTKAAFNDLLTYHPSIQKVHLLQASLSDTIDSLKEESFDFIIDLHHNIRSWRVRKALKVPTAVFSKENRKKYLLTRFKQRQLEISHTVERYGETLRSLGIELDGEGLEFYLSENAETEARQILEAHQFLHHSRDAIGVVLGATSFTKRWPDQYFSTLLKKLQRPAILIGGKDAIDTANYLQNTLEIPLVYAVGKYDLLTSAAIMKYATEVISHDTGFMHIAAAFKQKVYTLWGNTSPQIGFSPYKTEHYNLEVKDLSCRPCSKLGFDQCPKGHFKCMMDLNPEMVFDEINKNQP